MELKLMDHQKQDRTEKLTQEELSLLIKVKNVTRNLILFVGIASIALLLLSPNVISGINSSIIIISALITILIIVLAMFILLGTIIVKNISFWIFTDQSHIFIHD